ncbi:hypothetical protein WJX79_000889 [Trebouxia sp. C0005]
MQLSLQNLQIDDQLSASRFAVVLSPADIAEEASEYHPLLSLAVISQPGLARGQTYYPLISFQISKILQISLSETLREGDLEELCRDPEGQVVYEVQLENGVTVMLVLYLVYAVPNNQCCQTDVPPQRRSQADIHDGYQCNLVTRSECSKGCQSSLLHTVRRQTHCFSAKKSVGPRPLSRQTNCMAAPYWQ